MYDLKEKQAQVKSKLKAIQIANNLKTSGVEKLGQFDDTIENLQKQLGSTIDEFGDKLKQKLPNTENLFEKITGLKHKWMWVKI
jgi:uncharacterized phage infection (PIP) family protein YhgE